MLVGALDEGRIVVVGDKGTGLKPSIRVVETAGTEVEFKSIDGGVGDGGGGGRALDDGEDLPLADGERYVAAALAADEAEALD